MHFNPISACAEVESQPIRNRPAIFGESADGEEGAVGQGFICDNGSRKELLFSVAFIGATPDVGSGDECVVADLKTVFPAATEGVVVGSGADFFESGGEVVDHGAAVVEMVVDFEFRLFPVSNVWKPGVGEVDEAAACDGIGDPLSTRRELRTARRDTDVFAFVILNLRFEGVGVVKAVSDFDGGLSVAELAVLHGVAIAIFVAVKVAERLCSVEIVIAVRPASPTGNGESIGITFPNIGKTEPRFFQGLELFLFSDDVDDSADASRAVER